MNLFVHSMYTSTLVDQEYTTMTLSMYRSSALLSRGWQRCFRSGTFLEPGQRASVQLLRNWGARRESTKEHLGLFCASCRWKGGNYEPPVPICEFYEFAVFSQMGTSNSHNNNNTPSTEDGAPALC
eukprot:12914-Heterococcus_DN1.PRE.1